MTVEPVTASNTAIERARAAREWLGQGVRIATRPGATDPAPGMREALTNATEAIREAIDSCGDLHAARGDLHLALDEANAGLAGLVDPGPGARLLALRNANVAGGVLDRVIAALDEYHGAAAAADDPAC